MNSLILLQINIVRTVETKNVSIKNRKYFSIQLIRSGSQLEIFRPIGNWLVFSTWIFIFCYFGDCVTDAFHSIGPAVYQSQWYLLPLKMKKKLPLMLAISQNPKYMYGYLNIQCNLEIFAKVQSFSQFFFTIISIEMKINLMKMCHFL